MSLNFFLLFTITVLTASIIPGPSMLLALTHGIQFGIKRTLSSAFGNMTITFIQASVSIAGLGSILVTSEPVFQCIKWVGAVYLVYVGISMLFSAKQSLSTNASQHYNEAPALKKLFLQSAIVTAGNPKAILFFTAIFPQFMDPGTAFLPQFCLLTGICSCIAFFCFMLYAICGNRIVSLFSGADAGKAITRIMGGTFIGIGIGLAVSKR